MGQVAVMKEIFGEVSEKDKRYIVGLMVNVMKAPLSITISKALGHITTPMVPPRADTGLITFLLVRVLSPIILATKIE